MSNRTNLHYLLLLLVLTTACGPLVPLSYNKNDITAATVQSIETDEATVILEYIELKYGHYIFDLEVINHTSNTIYAAPQLISFYASPKQFIPLHSTIEDVHTLSAPNSALTMKRQVANSPSETRRLYEEKAKSKASLNILFAVVGAGLIIYDAVKDSEDAQQETWTKKDENKAIGRDLLVSIALTASDVAQSSAYQAEDARDYLPYEVFTECSIKPGTAVRGKIFIPMESSYRFSRVVIPIHNIDYVFDLKRRGVKTTQSQ